MSSIGWYIPKSEGSLFVWAHIPEYMNMNSQDFSIKLLEHTGIVVVPGSAFGELGEGYVRFAVVLDNDKIKQAVSTLKQSKFLEGRR